MTYHGLQQLLVTEKITLNPQKLAEGGTYLGRLWHEKEELKDTLPQQSGFV